MTYVVAVRTLCDFTAKRGDLDLRFTPSPTALEGIEGHATVTSRRQAGYEAEMTLSGTYGELTVRGRADGYDPVLNRLEEIKTYRGQLQAMPDNHRALHWAQALVYGHLLCEARGLAQLNVALVYFDIGSRKETVLTQAYDAASLRTLFEQQCERFLDWAMRESAHRRARDAALERLAFPYGDFRSGQRELAVAVYRAARDGRTLMAQAPTGIGKTLATLFPVLKACGQGHVERVFFLTAKTPGRALALDAIDALHRADGELPLRTLELVARDKACEHPDKSCHGESCPLASGFYDRLPAARETALANRRLDRDTVRRAASAHDVCPYYLAQELTRWCDIVVGDYNYYYDSSALLHALTRINQWRVAVLVDEAHNLLERGRKMYSADIEQAAFKAAGKTAPAILKKPLQRLQREWNALNRGQTNAYQAYTDVPERLLSAAQNLIGAVTDHLAEAPLSLDDTLLRVFFDAMHFVSLSEQFGEHSVFDVQLRGTGTGGTGGIGGTGGGASIAGRERRLSTLCVRNVVPAHFLAARHATAHATVMFSGTFAPEQFYRDMLGLPEATAAIDVEGPFRAQQLEIHVAAHVSTRWRDRERSLRPIVDLMARQYASRPGNYLGFLSSFDYLQRIAESMRAHHPDVPIWTQAPGMDEAARDEFLARFSPAGSANCGIGLAVLGGAFSEGVDLVGDRLIGAFVATLGLPQVNEVNEEMRRKMDAKFGSGYDYVYLYPGLQKIVQAAGRVIRTETDVGVLHLIDDRYRRAEVKRLLPRWWAVP
jgi:DNA excision repair protein ERCC-2